MIRALLGLLLAAGCYSPSVPNGQLKCSADGKCPQGLHCATDRTCWKNGQDPVAAVDMAHPADAGEPDLAKPAIDMAMMPGTDMSVPSVPHKGTSVLSGAVKASSQHYTIIMSTGQTPGGNGPASSTTKQLKSGLVGATQKK